MSLDTEAVLNALSETYPVTRIVGNDHTGIIIALSVPPDMAQAIAQGSESADEMHVTLAYLGDCAKLSGTPAPWFKLVKRLAQVASSTPPLTAHFGGPGSFLGVGDSGTDAHYLNLDAPGINPLREACVKAAEQAGLDVSHLHSFMPHVTVSYGGKHPLSKPPLTPFPIGALELWFAGHRVMLPFGGQMSKADAPRPSTPAADPRQDAQVMYAELTRDLMMVHAGERHITALTDHLNQHHAKTFEAMTQAIPAPRGSALEEAALHHAGEAAGARRVGTQ